MVLGMMTKFLVFDIVGLMTRKKSDNKKMVKEAVKRIVLTTKTNQFSVSDNVRTYCCP